MYTKSFAELGVPKSLVNTLSRQGITSPFPIQIDTLPDTLSGRDVLGRGRTGSGKTLAFSIPMVVRLAQDQSARSHRGKPRGLVLAPTRELATQIATTLKPLASAMGLRVTTVFGGVSQSPQAKAIREGVEIVVATPGRLEDLMKQGILKLDAIEITVLDEADHMADLGFLPGVTRILAATPKDGQRLMFSATLDKDVSKLVDRFLSNQVTHTVEDSDESASQMTHHVFETSSPEAKSALVSALASGKGRRILFLRTKHHAMKLAKSLTLAGIPAVDLHGALSQNARNRNLAEFSSGGVRVLVATDVAARGVHVDDVSLVIHVDPPAEHKAYLHRSGRTARAGAAGNVVTLCLPNQRRSLADLMRKANVDVSPVRVTPSSAEVIELIGEVAPFVKPRPVASQSPRSDSQGAGKSMGRNAQRKRLKRGQNPSGQVVGKSRNPNKPAATAGAGHIGERSARPAASPGYRGRRRPRQDSNLRPRG
jgi:superfamily II DNA/RNA helicase